MNNVKKDPQNLTLGHLLARVSRLVGTRTRRKLEGIGLRHAQGMILHQLWQHDGIAQNVLAHALHITPPTATTTLQRMERNGWIERRRHVTDQRVVQVYLTGKAKALRAEARASFQELDKELTSVLTDEERDILMTLLLKVHFHLSQSMEVRDPYSPRKEEPQDERKGGP